MTKKIHFNFIKIFIVLIIFSLILPNLLVNGKSPSSDIHIVLDTLNDTELPRNFRSTNNINVSNSINTKGMENLNISGSSQFSKANLPLLIKSINTNLPIIDIDLRQESHGFVNEMSISFKNEKNNANLGLSSEEVLLKEIKDLNTINLNNTLTFYNDEKNPVLVKSVENESLVISKNSIGYLRIAVTDSTLPNKDEVNKFITFVKNQPKNTHLHFHCKEGIGRTTTFMILYDMMKNYNDIPIEDIINRQIALAKLNEKDSKTFYNKDHTEFFTSFYNYCKASKDLFLSPWQ